MRTRTLLLAAAAFGALFALFVTTEIYLLMLTHGPSYALLLGWQLLSMLPWVLLVPVVARVTRHLPLLPPTPRGVVVHALAAAVLGTLHLAYGIALEIGLQVFDWRTPGPGDFWRTFISS